jgi:hypothetical protein
VWLLHDARRDAPLWPGNVHACASLHAARVCAAVSPQVCAEPQQLVRAVQQFDASQLQPLPAGDAGSIAAAINDFMGRAIKTA